MNKVEIKCTGEGLIDLHDVEYFQGGLKTLPPENYEKLKNSLLKHGFINPFVLWVSKDGISHILDGHQRKATLLQIQEDGIEIPEKYPYITVLADSEKQAKQILLQMVSQYGKIDGQGLYDFMIYGNIEVPELKDTDLPDFDMDSFVDEYFNDGELEDIDDELPDIDYTVTAFFSTENEANKFKKRLEKEGIDYK